jgi:hypothetical protein
MKMRRTEMFHTHAELGIALGLGEDITRIVPDRGTSGITVGNGEWRLERDDRRQERWRLWLYPLGSPVTFVNVAADPLFERHWNRVAASSPRDDLSDTFKRATIDLWFEACEQVLAKVMPREGSKT